MPSFTSSISKRPDLPKPNWSAIRGKPSSSFCSRLRATFRAAALAKRGVRFLAVSSDLSMLRAGAAAALKVLKG